MGTQYTIKPVIARANECGIKRRNPYRWVKAWAVFQGYYQASACMARTEAQALAEKKNSGKKE